VSDLKKLSNGLDTGTSGLSLGGVQPTSPHVSALPLDEIDVGLASRIPNQNADGVLLEFTRDSTRRTSCAFEEHLAGSGSRLDEVNHDGGLADTLPEASCLDVSRSGKVDRSELLNTPAQSFGIGRDPSAFAPSSCDSATDEKPHGTNRAEGSESAPLLHGSSLTDPRDELQRRRGRNDMKRWLFVDMSQDPIVVETCWLSAFAATHLTWANTMSPTFVHGADGRWRAAIAAKDFDESVLVALFMRVARAMAAEWAK